MHRDVDSLGICMEYDLSKRKGSESVGASARCITLLELPTLATLRTGNIGVKVNRCTQGS